MTTWLQMIFVAGCLILMLPVVVLALQVAAGSLPQQGGRAMGGRRPSVTVLIPAHDESAGILTTLASVGAQLRPGDRLLVVADNCTDDTAAVAAAGGAEVLQRHDKTRRGKGYALDYGIRYLERQATPPEVIVIVDADCLLGAGSLDALAQTTAMLQRPVQACYLMQAPAGAGLGTKIAEFAWLVKNQLRPLGWRRLGLPCQLMGAGMAFPWPLICSAQLASGHLVEDLKLGLDMAAARQAPHFCPAALVTSQFPQNGEGVRSQRTRWEHGHLGVLLQEGPRLVALALRTGNVPLLALALDLCIPPLALLTLLSAAAAMAGLLGWLLTGTVWPWSWPIVALGMLGGAVLLAWARCGRPVLSLASLTYAPVYALRKLPLYFGFLLRRQVEWVRSRRD